MREPHSDFIQKVAGTLPYADDWGFPGMLHGVVVRAHLPCAKITGIDVTEARAVPGVRAVLTAADIPHNVIAEEASGLGIDAIVQPVLASDRVRYDGEPVAVIAAETPGAAVDAAALVEVVLRGHARCVRYRGGARRGRAGRPRGRQPLRHLALVDRRRRGRAGARRPRSSRKPM